MRSRGALALVLAAMMPPLAAAEPPPLDRRVGTLEKQMQAVQRKVFPGGDARYFTPDITPDVPPAAAPEGTPASAPLADLTTRVDALERQVRGLTGAVEEAQNQQRVADETFAKYRGDTDFRLNAIEHPAQPAAPPLPTDAPPPAKPVKPAKPLPAKDDAAAQAVLTVEEQWRAAYALYVSKDYPAAETAMTAFLAANPKAARASNAQYWLGRSYMAHEQSALAAKAFLDGYKKYPTGERAPDSLLWLGNALTALKKPTEACQALDELPVSYPDRMTPALRIAAAKARKDAKCGG